MVDEAVEDLVDHPQVAAEPWANCPLTSTRYCVSPSRRVAVIRRTATAAPGLSLRNESGSSMTRTSTGVAARTVAVADRSRTHDISPNTAPGWSIRANGTRSFSMVTEPDTSTYICDGCPPSMIRTSPSGTDITGRSAQ